MSLNLISIGGLSSTPAMPGISGLEAARDQFLQRNSFCWDREGHGPRLCGAGTYLVFSQTYQFSFLPASTYLHFQSCLALQFLSVGVCRQHGLEC